MLARLNHKAARQHLHDAVAKGDPTGTLDIRRKYRAALEMRWRRLGSQLRMVLVTQDMLGLGGKTTVLSLSMTSLAPDGVLRSFQSWLDATLKKVVLQDEATYLDPMIEGTFKRALVRAMRLTKNKAMPADARDTISTLQQLTLMELQGIVEALSQRVVRLASWAQLDNVKPPVLMRQVQLAIEQVGVARGRALIESMVVKAHSTATLDQFEVAGVKRVGLLPEIVRANPKARKRFGDAVEPAKRRGTREEVPSKRTVQRIAGEERKVEQAFGTEQVEIETAGDDKVCPECEELAADGPYTIDEARGLIPAHPWCRCAFVPEGTDLFGNLLEFGDEWSEEDHPRDPGGEGGGQFTSGGGGLGLEEEKHGPRFDEREGRFQGELKPGQPPHKHARFELAEVKDRDLKQMDPVKHLTDPRDKVALDSYYTPQHAILNHSLRTDSLEEMKWLDRFKAPDMTGKEVVSRMDRIYADHAVELKKDTILFRGMNTPDITFKPGMKFVDKGFASASPSHRGASLYGRTMIHITVPKGTRVIGTMQTEREVTLNRGTKFEVTGMHTEVVKHQGYTDSYHHVQVKVIK